MYSRSSTLNGASSEITASMDSFNHVFFSPRVQLDIHVAQTSMLLFDVRSTRSDVERRDAAGQERFQSKGAHSDEYAFTRCQHGFRVAVGALVLTCFDAKRRYDLLVRTR